MTPTDQLEQIAHYIQQKGVIVHIVFSRDGVDHFWARVGEFTITGEKKWFVQRCKVQLHHTTVGFLDRKTSRLVYKQCIAQKHKREAEMRASQDARVAEAVYRLQEELE